MRGHTVSPTSVFVAAAFVFSVFGASQVAAQSAQSLLNTHCASCHEPGADGGLSRISAVRKSPEGWDMTIVRMMVVHGVDMTASERAALVKHLADKQGLAPSEAAPFRYILERRPDATDAAPNEDLAAMCGRCHSFARVGLQRRDRDEWLKLVHFHLGQFPTTEYQALGRDRDWFGIASTAVVDELAKLYPLSTDAWNAWKGHAAPDLSGAWRLVGTRAGIGAYEGTQTITKSGDDTYGVSISVRYGDGTRVKAKGNAILYSGYELRGRLTSDNGEGEVLAVLAVSEGGDEISGRWFFEDSDVVGGEVHAVRGDAGARILSVAPGHMKKLHNRILTISGIGLGGDVDLGPNVRIVKVHSASAEKVVVEAMATSRADTGPRAVSVGGTSMANAVVVYDTVDAVRVEPAVTIARVGGGGGPLPPVPAQLEAIGYMNGPDGKADTDDDVRIGMLKASWRHENFDEAAAAMEDAKFAGSINPGTGLFSPAAAGPNPERRYGTNNVGNLKVVATVKDGDRSVEGSGQLFVTVQRWVDPPIR